MVDSVLDQQIALFLKHVNQVLADHFAENSYHHKPSQHRAEYTSDKWCKIIVVNPDTGTDQSVYCWVCLKDGYTKVLGDLHVGDIHRPASWKAPSKHARGNVLRSEWSNAGPHGMGYLR